jgi:hypothetical protein
MDRGPRKPVSTRDAGFFYNVMEGGFGIVQKQRAPPQRNEYVIIQGSIGEPQLDVPFQCNLCCLVKGNKAALAEF